MQSHESRNAVACAKVGSRSGTESIPSRALGVTKGDQMSSGKRSRVGRNIVKPVVVAVALALPGAASFAASMTDVVTTRSDQNIDEQYGRDSVYAFSRDAKPLKPEQTASRSDNFIGKTFDKTKGFVVGAW